MLNEFRRKLPEIPINFVMIGFLARFSIVGASQMRILSWLNDLLVKEPRNKYHADTTAALRDRMHERQGKRGREWPILFDKSLTKT